MIPSPPPASDHPLDVVIVGAGISGIGMAAHLVRDCPRRTLAIVERRAQAGGTWDLFRYPGVRSDSDMYTLGYAFAPWRADRAIAPGAEIRDYLDQVIDDHDLRGRIRFGQHVIAAAWDSGTALWTLTIETDCAVHTLAARFLFLGAGYYDADNPHQADIPGLDTFAGPVLHPQFWPEQFDHAGQRIVVIGSGATAISLIPALTETAAHVTMLQRTPSWYLALPSRDRMAHRLRRLLPERWAHALIRARNVRTQAWVFRKARADPGAMGEYLTGRLRDELGPAFVPEHFAPPYGPWEQRLCLVPDGDLFALLRDGRAEIVAGTIARVEADGIRLDDESFVPADTIVTATGLRLAVAGKIAVSVDGTPVDFSSRFYYRDCMFSNVPNLAALFGYLNAGWTLRVDIVAERLCRMFNQMDAWGMAVATPVLAAGHDLIEDPLLDAFSSGYIRRDKALMPKSATTAPWRIRMDYLADRAELREAPIDDGVLRFDRAPGAAASACAL